MASPSCGSICARRASAGRSLRAIGLASVLLAALPACLCPPSSEDLVSTGFRTPRQTLASFQTYLRADLPIQEYLCFSAGFRRRNGISAATYAEARERLFEEQPWIRLVAKAEVAGEEAESSDVHWFDAQVLGRTVRVKLVREGFFEIFAAERRLADDYAEFDALVEVRPAGQQAVLTARIPYEPAAGAPDPSEVVVARHWKIDDLFQLEEGDERLPPLPAPDSAAEPSLAASPAPPST